MTIVALRRADLEQDRQQITTILQRNLPGVLHDRRFEWLYLNNPAGRAWSWMVCETATQAPIGVASVFPRMVRIGGKLERCGQVGDFAIDLNYRSLGPAMILQRATFKPIDEGQLAFCYDCPPHGQGMAPFRRLGMGPYCRVARFARLQRSRRELEKRLGPGKLSSSLSHVFDYFLTQPRWRRRRHSGIEIAIHQGRFGEEFTHLDEQVGDNGGIRGRRSAAELNWRYLEDPLSSYRAVTARRCGELVGYCVFTTRGEDAFVVDLLALDLDPVGTALLDTISRAIRAESIQALYAFAAEPGANATFLNRIGGFSLRSYAASVVVYAGEGTAAKELLKEPGNWFFCYADLLA